jgi:hypothetical protein
MAVKYLKIAKEDLEAALNHTSNDRRAADSWEEEAEVLFDWLKDEGCEEVA